MDLYEIRGGRLGVIAEEAELQELSRESTAMDNVGSPPSPTGAEDGSDGEEDAFKEGETEGEIILIRDQLQEKVAEMESFAGHLEEIFLTVEENFGRQEQHLEQHYNDVLQTLSQRQDESAARLEEEKKSKLEALYGQLLACGQALDASKELIETAQEVYRSQDKRLFLKTVMPTIKRIEEFAKDEVDLTLSTCLEFNTPLADLSDVKTMMDSINVVPAPSAPVINPQMPNSATQTSLRVCWSLFSDDTVEYYELYYRPVLEDTPADSAFTPQVSKVTLKETHCTVADLLPNAQYELWVMATNTTGISPASEKALYMTVPSPPVIKQRECSSCPEAALIRWESGNTNPVDSYTVELREMGADGTESSITESIVAVPTCQCLIQLQPGRYLISVRAVNIGGPSDRSEPITITTTGTFFYLLEDTAHPCLSISEDGFTIFYGDEELPISAMALDDNTFTRCVAVLGDLIPVRGRHYWEVEVDDGTEFRIGVAYEDTERNSYLGANSTSWCMRHILSPSRHKYEFLHNGWSPDLRITVNPVRIGVALDYDRGTLSFFNVNLEQHLHTFHCHFRNYVHPCFSLDNPGALTVHNGIEAPEYTFI
ncbi:fibronectin type III and SPRY domain-containing protein 2 [Neolamprologus brichardi]|uniref:Fibronectin type III and SPRY domain containing 2 n=1 Tax=Neolamprologus brichardi TaxID=32507 RepID=A0A3Q4I026_NEOBR|nr:fibronectin type III and SPRY domain-containing protein 2 [Neolamprologus brichardi]XP_006780498.1 fibronectin type III and SPRY domain-containing protein 2 [Neolamprologus brichardi]XP_006780500.1 fibronectin type III and SPRY domain-containing protein 2 [Neolamprologus brichardi]XP_006780501.1 fibronectin type III and SPRY domain-containing protein 2 [Neolamprologus brichardi]